MPQHGACSDERIRPADLARENDPNHSRRDLNNVLSISNINSVDSLGTSDYRPLELNASFELTLVCTMRKPFNVLAEGLISKNSRGDRIRTCDFMVPNHAL